MSKKIALTLFTSSLLLLTACNDNSVEDTVSTEKDLKAEEVTEVEEEVEVEEISEISGPVITSSEFIFSNLGKISDPIDPERYEEVVGYNPERDYYLIREKNRMQDSADGVLTNFEISEITSDSEQNPVGLYGIKHWYQDGYTYKLFDTQPEVHEYMNTEEGIEFEPADNIVRKDFFLEETGENQLLYEEGTLKNDIDLQNEIGEFEFHYLHPVNFGLEEIELKNDTFDVVIHSISYTGGSLEMNIEILSNEDAEIDINVFEPYNDMNQTYSNVNVYKDIPLTETVSIDGVSNLFLEDRIIISFGEEYVTVDFKKNGYKLGNEINRKTVFTDSVNLLGLEEIQYEIFPEEDVAGTEYYVETGYLKGNYYEEEPSLTTTTKELNGSLAIPEKVRSFKLELIQDSYIQAPIVRFDMTLKNPDHTAALTPRE